MTTPLQEAINDLRFMRDRATDAFSDIVWGMAISILRDVYIEKERQFLDAAREDEAVWFRIWCDENHWVRVAPNLYATIYNQDFGTTEYNAISLKELYTRFTNSRTTQ